MSNEVMKKNDSVARSVATPATLLEMAINSGADIEKLRELMDLQDRWEQKEAKKSFFDALSKFQSIVPDLKKTKKANINSQKGGYSYTHSDLGDIGASIKPALKECGISFRWETLQTPDKIKVTCLVTHKDGHTEANSIEAGKDMSGGKNEVQQIASTVTYLRRYTLTGALGLTTADMDDDGKKSNSATSKSAEAKGDDIDVVRQWEQEINSTKSQIELRALYLRNQKTVDGSAELQAKFKAREGELKSVKTEKVSLP